MQAFLVTNLTELVKYFIIPLTPAIKHNIYTAIINYTILYSIKSMQFL